MMRWTRSGRRDRGVTRRLLRWKFLSWPRLQGAEKVDMDAETSKAEIVDVRFVLMLRSGSLPEEQYVSNLEEERRRVLENFVQQEVFPVWQEGPLVDGLPDKSRVLQLPQAGSRHQGLQGAAEERAAAGG